MRTTFLRTGAGLGFKVALGGALRLGAAVPGAVVFDDVEGFLEVFCCCGLGNLGHPL